MFRGNWKEALALLDATNNLPEITGRVCPALCEYSCVLGLNDDAVTIRENELTVVEFGFKSGLIKPRLITQRTGKKIAIIGSGPAGLSCAAELNQAGHQVTIFERDNLAGGILRYGIPDFKLEKYLLDRRIDIWKEEGIIFKTGINVGVDYPVGKILAEFDALCLAGGSRIPRDINIEGRNLKGIYFAMDYLTQSNRRVAGEKIPKEALIDAKNKKVVVIGGGDTGSDCVGTAHRQGSHCVVQIEILPQPAEYRTQEYPWPKYPVILKTSSSHEEGGKRHWSVSTKKFIGEKGEVKKLLCEKAKGEKFEIEADLIVIAAGFLHPEHSGLLSELKVMYDERGNVKTDENYMTSVKKIFSAGDMRRGQSLVVWAISEGRRAAYSIDKYLMGKSNLKFI
jgi:glutamate synthase (NADPH/NADH) small chain